MTRYRPLTVCGRTAYDRSEDGLEAFAASSFASFLLHRHSSRLEELQQRSGTRTARTLATGRGRVGR